LIALDRCSLNEGFTPILLALKSEKEDIAQYLIQISIIRENMKNKGMVSNSISSKWAKLSDLIAYRDKKSRTALLISSKVGFINTFKLIFNLGCNFYATCSKLNNALHYANMSENEELVKFISWSDAENSTGYYLHNAKNVRGMLPIDYDRKKKFYDIVYHIWESASIVKSNSALERITLLLKNRTYGIN
jgi:ankyrin repeat protein